MSDPIKYPKTISWKTMRNEEIAKIVGCHPNTVLRHRAEKGKPKAPRKPGSGSLPRILDSKIDLSKTAAWNAKKQNAHPQWIAYRMRLLREKLKQADATSDDKEFWG
jgi:hypothetical protein